MVLTHLERRQRPVTEKWTVLEVMSYHTSPRRVHRHRWKLRYLLIFLLAWVRMTTSYKSLKLTRPRFGTASGSPRHPSERGRLTRKLVWVDSDETETLMRMTTSNGRYGRCRSCACWPQSRTCIWRFRTYYWYRPRCPSFCVACSWCSRTCSVHALHTTRAICWSSRQFWWRTRFLSGSVWLPAGDDISVQTTMLGGTKSSGHTRRGWHACAVSSDILSLL